MNTTQNRSRVLNGHTAGTDMMPVIENGKVDARSLHESLEIRSRFNDWIARRIEEYNFSDGDDYYSNLSTSANGRRRIDYTLTLDTAKELAMVERNEKGRQIRRYFIECEKELRSRPAAEVVFGGGTLESLQSINSGLIKVATEHASRIGDLESSARAGEDWISLWNYLEEQWGVQLSNGRLAALSKRCLQYSAMHHYPVGEEAGNSGHRRRTFSPVVLDECVTPMLERWEHKDRQIGRQLF